MPLLFDALQRNDRRSSKSPNDLSLRIRKVLPLAFLSASLVSPRIAPSLTDQRRGSPSQPVRSLPLKRGVMSFGSGGASARERGASRRTMTSAESDGMSDRFMSPLYRRAARRGRWRDQSLAPKPTRPY